MRWNKLAFEGVPSVERHTKATHCNSTPATDGKHIVAIFGSEGLFCFDMNGRQLWRKNLGKMDAGPYDATTLQWGFASSPIIYENKIFVQCDVISERYLAAFDIKDGHQIWRTSREELGGSWCTPNVAVSKGRKQIICNGWKHIGGFDVNTGAELWRLEGGGDIPVPTPARAYSGHRQRIGLFHQRARKVSAIARSAPRREGQHHTALTGNDKQRDRMVSPAPGQLHANAAVGWVAAL